MGNRYGWQASYIEVSNSTGNRPSRVLYIIYCSMLQHTAISFPTICSTNCRSPIQSYGISYTQSDNLLCNWRRNSTNSSGFMRGHHHIRDSCIQSIILPHVRRISMPAISQSVYRRLVLLRRYCSIYLCECVLSSLFVVFPALAYINTHPF